MGIYLDGIGSKQLYDKMCFEASSENWVLRVLRSAKSAGLSHTQIAIETGTYSPMIWHVFTYL